MINGINKIEQSIKEMEGGQFQKFCDRYLYEKNNWNLKENFCDPGSMQGTNKTTAGTPDSYVMDGNGKYILVMYGTRLDAIKKLENDIQDAKDKSKISINCISKIICCYGGNNVPAYKQEELKRIADPCDLELISSTSMAYDILQNYYQIAVDFCGFEEGTDQIFGLQDFISIHDKSELNAPISNPYIEHDDQLGKIQESIEYNDITIITGKPGVGKTKSSVEIIKYLQQNMENNCILIKSNSTNVTNNLKLYLSTKRNNYIFIDDINEIEDLKHLLSLLHSEMYNIKILCTIRDYIISDLKNDISQYNYKVINLEAPNSNTLKKILVEGSFLRYENQISDNDLRKIQNNPRHSIICALAINKGIALSNNFKNILTSYYESIIKDINKSNSILDTLFLISVFNKLDLKSEHFIKAIGYIGQKELEFNDNLSYLEKNELCDVYKRRIASVSDQSLRDYVLYVYLFKKNNLLETTFIDLIGNETIVIAINNALSFISDINDLNKLEIDISNIYKKIKSRLDIPQKLNFISKYGSLIPDEAYDTIIDIFTSLNDKDDDNNYYSYYFFEIAREILNSSIRENYIRGILLLIFKLMKFNNDLIENSVNFIVQNLGADLNKEDIFLDPKRCIEEIKACFDKDNSNFIEFVIHLCDKLLDKHITNITFNGKRDICVRNWTLPSDERFTNFISLVFSLLVKVPNCSEIDSFIVRNFRKNLNAKDTISEQILLESLKMCNLNSDYKKLMSVDYFFAHNDGSCSPTQINEFDDFQLGYAMLSYYLKDSIKNAAYDKLKIDVLPGYLMKYDSYSKILKNSNFICNINRLIAFFDDKEKKLFISEIMKNDINNYNFYFVNILACEYGIKDFLKDFSDELFKHPVHYYNVICSNQTIENGFVADIKDVIHCMNDEQMKFVRLNIFINRVQENTQIIQEIISRSLKVDAYEIIYDLDVDLFKNIFKNISNKSDLIDICIKCMTKTLCGLEYGIAKFLIDNEYFISSLLEKTYRDDLLINYFNDYSNLLINLWDSEYFKEYLSKFLDDDSDCFQIHRSFWSSFFGAINAKSKDWLLKKLNRSNDICCIKNIMNLVNYYFNYEDSIPFFEIIKDKKISLKEIYPLHKEFGWSGSLIPVLETQKNFIDKLQDVFYGDLDNYIYLNKIHKNLEDRIHQEEIKDYVDK
ncbi:hypothetical protein HW41_06930 [Apilactobacillus kunkeei]|uniref:hypothetical protein n=1 Tax=Apilactobacillus kunkeei TaxID=148814 RepID=UPI00059B139D|nr:hypothetical protein [Apilactobacillus kunkeei]KIM18224.1 hypothetical protein HW41_06930 [Apilactobacillus kunkeei]